MEITRQADYYGLPDNSPPPVPSAEHLAEVLAKPVPWSGPTRIEAGSWRPGPDGKHDYGSDRLPGKATGDLAPSHWSDTQQYPPLMQMGPGESGPGRHRQRDDGGFDEEAAGKYLQDKGRDLGYEDRGPGF